MDFVDQPTQELVRVVMGVIVEKLVTCTDPGDKAAVVNDTSVALGAGYAFKQVL